MASIRYIVRDVDRSVEFYRDMLEFKLDKHNPGKFSALEHDDLTLYLSAPGAGSGGTAGGNPEPGGWNRLMFVTDDIDALIGDPNGHLIEAITRPYGSRGCDAEHPHPLLGCDD